MATATKKKPAKKTKQKTKAIIVLDRSSSMSSCAGAAVESYNEHVDEFQEQEKNGQEIEVSLVTFSGEVFEHIWNGRASDLQKSNLESFRPSGSTSLYAGMGYAIDKAMAEDDGETAYWLIVITDGDENSSQRCCNGAYGCKENPAIIAEVLEGCEKNGRWTISFLGASKDHILEATENFGGNLSAGNCAAWSNTAQGTRRMSAQNRKAAKSYFAARSQGEMKVEALYSSDGIADFTDNAEDAAQQDQALGLAPAAAPSGGAGGQSRGHLSTLDFADNWTNCSYSSNYVPENVGTADVFGTSNRVGSEGYQRPGKA